MKILIITQKIDREDDLLGFMHGWIAEFARTCERVVVLGLGVGSYAFSPIVSVHSLGKEQGLSRFRLICNFYRIMWQERAQYDAVFVHMNEVYILLGAIVWRLLGKKVTLWYAHGSVSWSLRVATLLTQIVFTSTKSGFRVVTPKKYVIGQAIDIEKFSPKERSENAVFTIITVGRISPSKDLETLVRAIDTLKRAGKQVRVIVVGKPAVHADVAYFDHIQALANELSVKDSFEFVGSVANDAIVPYLRGSDLFVNMGKTGSLDKAILEAMAVGLPILTCNEALLEVLGAYSKQLIYPKNDTQVFAEKMMQIMGLPILDRQKLGDALRDIVVEKHSLRIFVDKIMQILSA